MNHAKQWGFTFKNDPTLNIDIIPLCLSVQKFFIKPPSARPAAPAAPAAAAAAVFCAAA